jgi:hypothetical protein
MHDKFYVPEAETDKEHIYRWCNQDERSMLRHLDQGYEVCHFDTAEVPEAVKMQAGNIEAGPGGVTRRRGTDLILCRIRRTAHDENIVGPKREMEARHAGVVDAMVAQANEEAMARSREQGNVGGKTLIFKESDTRQFSR